LGAFYSRWHFSIGVVGLVFRSSSQGGSFALSNAITVEPITPDELLRQYIEHIENRRFEDMYGLLSQISQEMISREDFIARNRNIYEGIGARNFTFSISQTLNIAERQGREIIVYSLRMDTVAGEIFHENHQAVFELNANNEYRIFWTSRMIFPELGDNNRLRVSVIPAQRGNILDRHGDLLAGQGTASAVGFIPGRMCREEIPALNIPFIHTEIDLEEESEDNENEFHIPEPTFIYNRRRYCQSCRVIGNDTRRRNAQT
jgi:penicillin-binding protein